jgi:hypothetical protein
MSSRHRYDRAPRPFCIGSNAPLSDVRSWTIRTASIVRTGINANRMIAGNESSAVNRAVASYRHFVGIPTDRDPPAAR